MPIPEHFPFLLFFVTISLAIVGPSLSFAGRNAQRQWISHASVRVTHIYPADCRTHNTFVTMFGSEIEQQQEQPEEEEFQQEFDLDKMTKISQLNKVSAAIGGPVFDESYPFESARDELWDFVEDEAEDDIDRMCMGQLSGLMLEMGGEEFPDGKTLQEARDIVWDHAEKFSGNGKK